MILPQLQELQERDGYLADRELAFLAETLGEPLYRLQELASFFPHFRRQKPPGVRLQICRDLSCFLAGGAELRGVAENCRGESSADFSVECVSCLGQCDRAPAMVINDHPVAGMTAQRVEIIVEELRAGRPTDELSLPASPRPAEPTWDIDPYSPNDGDKYQGVRNLVADAAADRSADPWRAAGERLLKMVETAGLLGMGGAGGRTYKKWEEVLLAKGQTKYVVCNADESEPGTFKDRELLYYKPHLILEGMILAGLILGAQQGYLYIRHEYHEEIAAARRALAVANALGACGDNVLNSGRIFRIDIFVSPGGYICGEQTALIEVLEDHRAEPRNRPPALQTNGLHDRPTLINNVETFAWVPSIVLRDEGQWYASQGQKNAPGLRLFSVSGDVVTPGVYQAPCGCRFGDLLKLAGGMRDGRGLKAVALSGPSGGFLPAKLPRNRAPRGFAEKLMTPEQSEFDILDLPLDVRQLRNFNLLVGAGIMVIGEGRNLLDLTLNCLEFFRNESCGKCVPCRLGSQKLVDMAGDIRHGKAKEQWFDTKSNGVEQPGVISDLANAMELASICGLGQVAYRPLTTLLRYFPEEIPGRAERDRGTTRQSEERP